MSSEKFSIYFETTTLLFSLCPNARDKPGIILFKFIEYEIITNFIRLSKKKKKAMSFSSGKLSLTPTSEADCSYFCFPFNLSQLSNVSFSWA